MDGIFTQQPKTGMNSRLTSRRLHSHAASSGWTALPSADQGCAGGRYWDRTSDLFRVREARYRCANPFVDFPREVPLIWHGWRFTRLAPLADVPARGLHERGARHQKRAV